MYSECALILECDHLDISHNKICLSKVKIPCYMVDIRGWYERWSDLYAATQRTFSSNQWKKVLLKAKGAPESTKWEVEKNPGRRGRGASPGRRQATLLRTWKRFFLTRERTWDRTWWKVHFCLRVMDQTFDHWTPARRSSRHKWWIGKVWVVCEDHRRGNLLFL